MEEPVITDAELRQAVEEYRIENANDVNTLVINDEQFAVLRQFRKIPVVSWDNIAIWWDKSSYSTRGATTLRNIYLKECRKRELEP